MKPSFKSFRFGRVTLRTFMPRDAERIREIRNAPEVRSQFFSSHEVTREEHSDWLDLYSANDDQLLIVAPLDHAKIIGTAMLTRVTDAGSWSVDNVMVHPDHQGRQLGQHLVRGLCVVAWRLDALELELVVKKDNMRAIHVYEGAGFRILNVDAERVWMRQGRP